MAQAIAIVESQRPQRLPLDLQAEFHLQCDRASIAYRKWLKQLGVTCGTIIDVHPLKLLNGKPHLIHRIRWGSS